MSKENKTLDVLIEKMLDNNILDWNNPTNLVSIKRDFNYNTLIPGIKILLREILATVRPEEGHTFNLSPDSLPKEIKGIRIDTVAHILALGYKEVLAEYDENVKELLNEDR